MEGSVVAYLGTVLSIAALAIGAMYMIVNVLGKRVDDVTARLGRLENQNDAIIGAIGDLGQRVARLQSRG